MATLRIEGVSDGRVVREVLGTRLGRRCYLARLLGTPLPVEAEGDHRSLWAHWCVHPRNQFHAPAQAALKVDLRKAGGLRRWLWIWLGV